MLTKNVLPKKKCLKLISLISSHLELIKQQNVLQYIIKFKMNVSIYIQG